VTRRVAGVVASLAMAAALAACGSTASPTSPSEGGAWTPPIEVVRVAGRVFPNGIAAGGDTVLVTWTDENLRQPVRVARLAADGRWAVSEVPGSLSPAFEQVGVDRSGRAVLAWGGLHPDFGSHCAWAATAPPSGEWAAARILGCGVRQVGLAVGPSGHALVTFSWFANSLAAAPYDPVTGWQDLYTLSDGNRVLPQFDAAVDENGTYAVTWDERPERNDMGSIWIAVAHGRALTILPMTFSPGPLNFGPRVAFEAPGVAVATWASGLDRGVQVGHQTLSGGAANSIWDDPEATCPAVAGSGRGASMVAWSRLNNDAGPLRARGVYAASGANGNWEPRAIVTGQPLVPSCPQLAMDEEENAVAAWQESGTPGTPEIWAAVRPKGTREWGAPVRLAIGARQPEVALANRVAYVVWVTEAGDVIRESRLRLAP
jgi:hypothetical protein